MILSSRVKALPLKHYLGQLVSRSTTETIYNPFQFWRFYRTSLLERCWNWEKDWEEKLERCWQKQWKPEQPLHNQSNGDRTLNHRLNHQSSIELKWRGVSYRRHVVNLDGVTLPITNLSHYSQELPKDSNCQPSNRLS